MWVCRDLYNRAEQDFISRGFISSKLPLGIINYENERCGTTSNWICKES